MRTLSLIVVSGLSLLCLPCFSLQASAQETVTSAPSSASVSLAPADPAKLRAEAMDRLFANLHREKIVNPSVIETKIWDLWAANDSPAAEVLLLQASRAMRDGAYDASEAILDTLIDAEPDYVEALNRRATLYYKMQRYDDALADIDAVLEKEPRHFGALTGRGLVYQAQGSLSLAKQAYEEALSINPHLEQVKAALKQMEHDSPDI